MKHSVYCAIEKEGAYCDCGVVHDERDKLLEQNKRMLNSLIRARNRIEQSATPPCATLDEINTSSRR